MNQNQDEVFQDDLYKFDIGLIVYIWRTFVDSADNWMYDWQHHVHRWTQVIKIFPKRTGHSLLSLWTDGLFFGDLSRHGITSIFLAH